MNRVVIFGNIVMTEDATRNSILCSSFHKSADEYLKNTINFGFAKPEASPLTKVLYACLFSWLRWIVLFIKYLFMPEHNILFVPYPSHMDGWLACILGKIYHKIVIIDAFIGLYDTLVSDRGLIKKKSVLAKLIWQYEKCLLSWADIILVDTDLNGLMLKKAYGLPRTQVKAIPVGIDENLWKPYRNEKKLPFTVIFWCTFIPLHGAEVVAHSAKLLMRTDPDIKFIIIGTGQEAENFYSRVKELQLNNLVWIRRFISMKKIYNLMKKSHCCLGVFGNRNKTQRVIPYKVYQALASSQPVITANTEAAHQLLTHGKNAFLVNPNDPESLAEAILALKDDEKFAIHLGINGRRLYEKKLSNNAIDKKISEILKMPVDKNKCR